jgi:uncharacterized protein YgfB (UPF0149 family)
MIEMMKWVVGKHHFLVQMVPSKRDSKKWQQLATMGTVEANVWPDLMCAVIRQVMQMTVDNNS